MSNAVDPNARRIRSVMVVDDDVELAMMYKELLGSQGYIVNTASIAGCMTGFSPIYDASKHAVVAISDSRFLSIGMKLSSAFGPFW